VQFDIPRAGLCHTLTAKVRPWISSGKDRFDTLDQLNNFEAASEFILDNENSGGHHQQCQSDESQKGGEKKHNFQPSISNPVENTACISNHCKCSDIGNSKSGKSNTPCGGSSANLPLALWLSMEVDES